MERDAAREIQHIPAEMTFADGVCPGFGCIWPHGPDENGKQKMRRSLPAMKIGSQSNARR